MDDEANDKSSKFRDVEAFHDQMPPGPWPLRVSGEYFLNRRSGGVELQVAVPPGFNPDILLLNLKIVEGNGGDWVPFSAEFPMEPNAYSGVQIVDEDSNSVSAEIETAS